MGQGIKSPFFSLALQHREALVLLRKYGLLKGRFHLDNGTLQGTTRSYRNIAQHSLCVGLVTDIILEQAVLFRSITPQLRQRGVTAALLHDMLKRMQIEMDYGLSAGDEKQFINPIVRRRVDQVILHVSGLSEELLHVYSLSELSGDGVNWLEPNAIDITESSETLLKWVIFLADYMVAHTKLVSPEERIQEAIERNEYNVLFEWWYTYFFGEEDLLRVKTLPQGYRLIAEKQYGNVRHFLKQVDEQLHLVLSLGVDVSIVDFVRAQLEKRYLY